MSLTPETTEIVFNSKPAVKRVWRDSKGQEVRTTINGKPVDANGNILDIALTKELVREQKAEADKDPKSDAKILSGGRPITAAVKKENLFCATFIDNHEKMEGIFELLQKQLEKCDGYAFLSTYSDPLRNIFKVLPEMPPSSAQNWPIAEATAKFFLSRADKYNWFVKLDPDTVLIPKKMNAALAKYNPEKAIAVGRPGRHSTLPLVGAVYALSSTMVKALDAKHLPNLETGRLHGEDNVMSEWVPFAGGIIENGVNDDKGCTTFSSTDKEEVPSKTEISTMKLGKSYWKGKQFAKKAAADLGMICYSPELAAIHPVKDAKQMAELIAELD